MIKYLENTLDITDYHKNLFFDRLRYKFSLNFTDGDRLGMFASHFITNNKPSTETFLAKRQKPNRHRDTPKDYPVNVEEDRLRMVEIWHEILEKMGMPKPDFIKRLCINANYHRDVDVNIHRDFNPIQKNCYSMVTYLSDNPELYTLVWDEEGKEHRFEAKAGATLLFSNLEHTFLLPKTGLRVTLVGTFFYDN
jgi:hypothetical protein